MKDYYVYACLVKGILVYVGKGKGNRYLHCTSGTSSCKELNRDLFRYGIHNFKVIKVVEGLTEQDAFDMEKAVLMWDRDDSLYNKTYGISSKQKFDEYLALEFWFHLQSKTEKNFKWNGVSLFDDECEEKQ